MKTINLYNKKEDKNNKSNENNTNNTNNKNKTREVIKSAMLDISLCDSIEILFNNYEKQLELLQNLYNKKDFYERKFITNQIKAKISSYKTQDIKKNIHENNNLINFDNILDKLVNCNLKCHYCNSNLYLIFQSVRYKKQWTLDRINNLDEHSNDNTVISCLECNLQRRRTNSEKFLFTKQIQTKQILIKKLH
jgi:hypothetical protein